MHIEKERKKDVLTCMHVFTVSVTCCQTRGLIEIMFFSFGIHQLLVLFFFLLGKNSISYLELALKIFSTKFTTISIQ